MTQFEPAMMQRDAAGPRTMTPEDPTMTRERPMPAADGDDWSTIDSRLDADGFALLPGWLDAAGLGGLMRRGDAVLPPPIDAWCGTALSRLARIAERWQRSLAAIGDQAPAPAPVRGRLDLDRLDAGDSVPLLAQPDAGPAFPLILVALLSRPGEDFSGGEYVIVEQRPRMQSRALVLPLRQGDAALVTTAHRPVQGSRGIYRVHVRHGIARVRSGQRLGLTLRFDPRDGPGDRLR